MHEFRYRTRDGEEFSDLVEIITLDLNKLPDDEDSTELWYWMKFIKSDDEEVLDMLAQRNPQMGKAIGVLKELSADECTRMLYESREMARRDIASMMNAERKKLESVIADNAVKLADKDAEIARLRAELKNLSGNNA